MGWGGSQNEWPGRAKRTGPKQDYDESADKSYAELKFLKPDLLVLGCFLDRLTVNRISSAPKQPSVASLAI